MRDGDYVCVLEFLLGQILRNLITLSLNFAFTELKMIPSLGYSVKRFLL